MKHIRKTALSLLLVLTLLVCLGACAWADESWSGKIKLNDLRTINGNVALTGDVTLDLFGRQLTINGRIDGLPYNLTIMGVGNLVMDRIRPTEAILVNNLTLEKCTVRIKNLTEVFAWNNITVNDAAGSREIRAEAQKARQSLSSWMQQNLRKKPSLRK